MESWLNVDCDFFYDSPADLSVAPDKRLSTTVESLLGKLPDAGERRTLLGLDHHELLSAWDRLGVRGARCVHLDAHHDLFPDFNRAWELPLGIRGAHVGVGDYLFHALREGIVGHLVWVCPPWLDAVVAARQVESHLGRHLARCIEVLSYDRWAWSWESPTHTFLCLSPEWSHRGDLPVFAQLARSLGAAPGDIAQWGMAALARYEALARGEVPVTLRFHLAEPIARGSV